MLPLPLPCSNSPAGIRVGSAQPAAAVAHHRRAEEAVAASQVVEHRGDTSHQQQPELHTPRRQPQTSVTQQASQAPQRNRVPNALPLESPSAYSNTRAHGNVIPITADHYSSPIRLPSYMLNVPSYHSSAAALGGHPHVGPDATVLHRAPAAETRHADTPDLGSANQGNSAQLVLAPIRSLTDMEGPRLERQPAPATSDFPIQRQDPSNREHSATSRRPRPPPDM
jgi:hypothetical protein